MKLHICYVLVLVASISQPVMADTPCEAYSVKLSNDQQKNWSNAIANQLQVSTVDILKVLGKDRWRIVYVDTHQSDEVFLFYPSTPLNGKYASMWSGAATKSEGTLIEDWTLKNVPNIPKELASCFAWYVTSGR